MNNLFSLLLLSSLLFSCKENTTINNLSPNYYSDGRATLVMVIENSDNANEQIEDIAFNSYPNETRHIFSEVFGVPVDSLYNKDLNQILNQYGEPWQIAEIKSAGSAYYDSIIVLTDSTATSVNLINLMEKLSKEKNSIDLIFSLHGTSTSIQFFDNSIRIDKLTKQLLETNVKLRLLYQTNCRSAKALDNWTNIGLAGCNGTVGVNYLTIFAPINFVKSWTNGATYYDAVQFAYDEEIISLKSYNNVLPILDYITTGNYLSGSLPIISGRYFHITKDDYINIEKD
ncbi:MAG: hypothetical protein R2863_11655 [Candidatus Kapaibacterium sp.]